MTSSTSQKMNDSIFQILRMNLHSSPESELCAPPVRPSPQKDYHNAPLGQGRRSARDAPLGQPIAVEQVLAIDEAQYNGQLAFQPHPEDGKFKTELCRNFAYAGVCAHGDRCVFAHGANELRLRDDLNRKYRTRLCKTFKLHGYCPYGSRCHFIHVHKSQLDDSSDGSSPSFKPLAGQPPLPTSEGPNGNWPQLSLPSPARAPTTSTTDTNHQSMPVMMMAVPQSQNGMMQQMMIPMMVAPQQMVVSGEQQMVMAPLPSTQVPIESPPQPQDSHTNSNSSGLPKIIPTPAGKGPHFGKKTSKKKSVTRQSSKSSTTPSTTEPNSTQGQPPPQPTTVFETPVLSAQVCPPPTPLSALTASSVKRSDFLDPLDDLDLIPATPLLPASGTKGTTVSRGRLAVFQKLCSSDDSSSESEDEEDAQSPWPAIVNSMHRPEPTGYRIRKSSK